MKLADYGKFNVNAKFKGKKKKKPIRIPLMNEGLGKHLSKNSESKNHNIVAGIRG